MKIVRFQLSESPADSKVRVGCVEGETIVELATGDPLHAPAARRIGEHPFAAVRLLAPINRPAKYLAVGLNYALHSREAGFDLPEYPRIFNKQTTCVTGPGDPIHMPDFTGTLDYEGELGVVIGSACRNISEEDALDVVAGYVVLNDVSVREWQHRSPTITLAKSADTHGPVGPWLVTRDEVPDPQNLHVRTRIGDEILQDFHTNDMLYSIRHVISVLSHIFTLEPGDLIATGTGDGVGIARTPQRWLRVGETVTVEIDGLGSLSNPVIEQPANLGHWSKWDPAAATADETALMPAAELEQFSRDQGFLAKKLFVIFTRPAGGLEAVREQSDAHLHRQLLLEEAGILFGAGPLFSHDDATADGEGMIIVRADSLEEAHAIAREDPMHLSGARTYEIRPWLMNEGSISLRFDFGRQIARLI